LRALSTSVASKIEPGSAFPIVACSRAPLFELVQLMKKYLYMHARHDDDNVSMQLQAQAYSSTLANGEHHEPVEVGTRTHTHARTFQPDFGNFESDTLQSYPPSFLLVNNLPCKLIGRTRTSRLSCKMFAVVQDPCTFHDRDPNIRPLALLWCYGRFQQTSVADI
jgi:hypothetical protein